MLPCSLLKFISYFALFTLLRPARRRDRRERERERERETERDGNRAPLGKKLEKKRRKESTEVPSILKTRRTLFPLFYCCCLSPFSLLPCSSMDQQSA